MQEKHWHLKHRDTNVHPPWIFPFCSKRRDTYYLDLFLRTVLDYFSFLGTFDLSLGSQIYACDKPPCDDNMAQGSCTQPIHLFAVVLQYWCSWSMLQITSRLTCRSRSLILSNDWDYFCFEHTTPTFFAACWIAYYQVHASSLDLTRHFVPRRKVSTGPRRETVA